MDADHSPASTEAGQALGATVAAMQYKTHDARSSGWRDGK